jgi:acetyltransferase-like isoleucine patch superfamily enzyme/acyl carrier protein
MGRVQALCAAKECDAGMGALTRWWLRGCDAVGREVQLVGRPFIDNGGRLRLGDRVTVVSRPVPSHLTTGPNGTLLVEDDVYIGYGASVAAHASVRLGAGARVGPFALILDTDFHQAGNHAAAAQARPIEVGARAILEARVTLRAGSVVSGDIPSGAVASGVPARVEGDRPAVARSGEDVALRVQDVAQSVFALARAPALASGPRDLPQWDSLGSLRLLLALEEAFGITLNPEEMLGVHCLSDAVVLVQRRTSA